MDSIGKLWFSASLPATSLLWLRTVIHCWSSKWHPEWQKFDVHVSYRIHFTIEKTEPGDYWSINPTHSLLCMGRYSNHKGKHANQRTPNELQFASFTFKKGLVEGRKLRIRLWEQSHFWTKTEVFRFSRKNSWWSIEFRNSQINLIAHSTHELPWSISELECTFFIVIDYYRGISRCSDVS